MFFVYILQCNDRSYYVGHTDDIDKRLAQHQNGECGGYTSKRLPVKIVFLQTCSSRDEAFIFERKIKKWSRIKKDALIKENFDLVAQHAKKKF